MRELLILSAAFAATAAVVEIVVSRKLQSAFGTVVAVHAVGLLAVMAPAAGVRATTCSSMGRRDPCDTCNAARRCMKSGA